MPENYIGIMCGTSLDSLDLSLCDFEKNNKDKIFQILQNTSILER